MDGHSDFFQIGSENRQKNGPVNSIHFSQPCSDGEINSVASWNAEILNLRSYSPFSVVPALSQ